MWNKVREGVVLLVSSDSYGCDDRFFWDVSVTYASPSWSLGWGNIPPFMGNHKGLPLQMQTKFQHIFCPWLLFFVYCSRI